MLKCTDAIAVFQFQPYTHQEANQKQRTAGEALVLLIQGTRPRNPRMLQIPQTFSLIPGVATLILPPLNQNPFFSHFLFFPFLFLIHTRGNKYVTVDKADGRVGRAVVWLGNLCR